jgi:outer membrane PBP1 activator LpoA protein
MTDSSLVKIGLLLPSTGVDSAQGTDATKGFEPAPTTPEQFREFIRTESAKFAKIIVEADIKLE